MGTVRSYYEMEWLQDEDTMGWSKYWMKKNEIKWIQGEVIMGWSGYRMK